MSALSEDAEWRESEARSRTPASTAVGTRSETFLTHFLERR